MDKPLRTALEALPLRDGIIVALRAVRRAAVAYAAPRTALAAAYAASNRDAFDPAAFDAAKAAVEAWLAGQGGDADFGAHYRMLRDISRTLRYAALLHSGKDWTAVAASNAAGAMSDLCLLAHFVSVEHSLRISDPTVADVVSSAMAAQVFLRPMEGKHGRDNGPDSLYEAAAPEREQQWEDLRAHGLA